MEYSFIKTSLLVLVMSATKLPAQNYQLNWFTIDGGGGASTGGAFTLNGTIGQPDAGPSLSGGGFTITGGFWPGFTSSEPIPSLRIELAGTDVILSWPDPYTGYQLQEAAGLNGAGTSWGLVSQSPTIVGSEKQVRLPMAGSGRFFRLCKAGP